MKAFIQSQIKDNMHILILLEMKEFEKGIK